MSPGPGVEGVVSKVARQGGCTKRVDLVDMTSPMFMRKGNKQGTRNRRGEAGRGNRRRRNGKGWGWTGILYGLYSRDQAHPAPDLSRWCRRNRPAGDLNASCIYLFEENYCCLFYRIVISKNALSELWSDNPYIWITRIY
jgi:hypothetical protein